MSTFEAVIDLVSAKYLALLPSAGTKWEVGEPKRHEHAASNRVVCVGSSGTFEIATLSEGIPFVEDGQDYEATPVSQRIYDAEIDIHGRDSETTDTLFRNVFRALHLTLGIKGFVPERWEDIEPASVNNNGKAIRLFCQIRTLLMAEPETILHTVATFEHSDEFDGEELAPHEEEAP